MSLLKYETPANIVETEDEIPEHYRCLADYVYGRATFRSYQTVIDAAIAAVSLFDTLHLQGCCYYAFDPVNFYFDPRTGAMRILIDENINLAGAFPRVLGNSLYTVPELQDGTSCPSAKSDLHLIALLLYLLFCSSHPFEPLTFPGVSTMPKLQNAPNEAEGFVPESALSDDMLHFDVQDMAFPLWQCLPAYMKMLFYRAFRREGLQNPDCRPRAYEWLESLTRFRGEVLHCQCGNHIYIGQRKTTACEHCGSTFQPTLYAKVRDYVIPISHKTHFYRCQIARCASQDATQPMGRIVVKKDDPAQFGFLNLSGGDCTVVSANQPKKKASTGAVIPLTHSMTICFGTRGSIQIFGDFEQSENPHGEEN